MKAIILLVIFCCNAVISIEQKRVQMVKNVNQPIVKCLINGKTAYFLVDTGSDITCLNQSDAKHFKFNYRLVNSRGVVSGIEGYIVKHLVASKVDMQLSGIKLQTRFKVLDLDRVIESIYQDSRVRISGIIGSDILRKYNFIIDYDSGWVSFNSD